MKQIEKCSVELRGRVRRTDEADPDRLKEKFKRSPSAVVLFAGATPTSGGGDSGVVLNCRWGVLVGVKSAAAPEKARAAAGTLLTKTIRGLHGHKPGDGYMPLRLEGVQASIYTDNGWFVLPLVFSTTAALTAH
ncbi:MAG: hypothetical protein OXU22_09710 [Gammaproteobacteria bacterium]|nr:hypothetical protein [Gammaproteobacteria bacterium]